MNNYLENDPSFMPGRWSDCIYSNFSGTTGPRSAPYLVGVLKGEGIGPEVIGIALKVLRALEGISSVRFDLEWGGSIGIEAESKHGKPLTDEVIEFCRDVFSRGGAILTGPGGGRFVYDLRKNLDLFCKLNPLKVTPEMASSGHMKSKYLQDVDILLVRDNAAGIYQGSWGETEVPGEGRKAEHSFFYSEKQARRILAVGAQIARRRRGRMAVVVKNSGIPTISKLLSDCAADIASSTGVGHSMFDADYIAYKLVQNPQDFDVIVAPNMLGDILADLGGVLLGSRGLTYSGSFSSEGAAVYQTNHGSCHDLAGKDQANPVGQIFSLAMMLRESFGLLREAGLIERAVADVWRHGWRTADMAGENSKVIGTVQMGELIAETLTRLPHQP